MFFHNLIQISIAIFLVISIPISLIPQSFSSNRVIVNHVLQNIQVSDALLPRLVYHYSKFYEYLDIFLVILQGKSNMIGLHFAFHHLTTPWYTTMRVARHFRGWQVFAWLNAFHHALSRPNDPAWGRR
jgi:hypothetical protein